MARGGSNFSHVGVLAYVTLPFTIHTYRQYMEFNPVSRFVYTLKSGVPSTDYCICVSGTDTGMKGFSCCRAITIFMYLDERWKRYSSIIDSTNSNVKRLLFDSWFDDVGVRSICSITVNVQSIFCRRFLFLFHAVVLRKVSFFVDVSVSGVRKMVWRVVDDKHRNI